MGSRRPAPDTMTAAQLYESFFDLSTGGSGEWQERLMRYGLLVGDPGRSAAEDMELHELRAQLAAAGRDPGWEPVPRVASGETVA
ncbi:MAG: hypothetical protein IV100_23100 [Myxococcales bacterium]|nr:hypothetical protein [Myxococcales bacterium]